jgi:hypothetical protein
VGEDLPIDLFGALIAFLGTYTEEHEVVLVLEAISNAIDAGAKNVHIILEKLDGNFYIRFTDDGAGMSKDQFKNYHTVSFSTKQKGEGIGFAGVGAKIYLAADNGSEILTVTNGGFNRIFASRMYRIDRKIQYYSSLKLPVKEIIHTKEMREASTKKGTTYQVKLTEEAYYYFRNHLVETLQQWFTYAMMRNSPNIYVGDKMIEPFISGKEEKESINYKQKPIQCHFFYDCKTLADENRHIIYTVFGKRIINEVVDFEYRIVDSQRRRVCAIVDVSILAKHLITNKEGFEKNLEGNNIKMTIRRKFHEFLDKKGFIRDSEEQVHNVDLFTKALERKLDKLLQQKEFKILNPFIDQRSRSVILQQNDGNVAISRIDTGQDTFEGHSPRHITGPTITIGPDLIKGFVRDDAGDDLGKEIETKSRGLSILPLPFADDNREGWLDLGRGGSCLQHSPSICQNLSRHLQHAKSCHFNSD